MDIFFVCIQSNCGNGKSKKKENVQTSSWCYKRNNMGQNNCPKMCNEPHDDVWLFASVFCSVVVRLLLLFLYRVVGIARGPFVLLHLSSLQFDHRVSIVFAWFSQGRTVNYGDDINCFIIIICFLLRLCATTMWIYWHLYVIASA